MKPAANIGSVNRAIGGESPNRLAAPRTNLPVLAPERAHAEMDQLGRQRMGMSGVNHYALPAGDVRVNAAGARLIETPGGKSFVVRKDGTISAYASARGTAAFRPDGSIRTAHFGDVSVAHGIHGERLIATHRQDGTLIVATGPHRGFYQQSFEHHGRVFRERVYVHGAVVTTRLYRPMIYGNVEMVRYVAPVYYSPAFYSWIGSGWGTGVQFNFGWSGSPWMQYYGGGFVPTESYASPAAWMSDYVAGESLSEDFDTFGASERSGGSGMTPMPTETRDALASQVQYMATGQQTEAAYAAGKSTAQPPDIPAALDPQITVFHVIDPLTVQANGTDCALSPGDWLRLPKPAQPGSMMATLRVASRQNDDCPADTLVAVKIADLQEMHNRLAEHVSDGLETLAHPPAGMTKLPAPPEIAEKRVNIKPPKSARKEAAEAVDGQLASADQAERSVVEDAFDTGQHE